MRKLLFSIKDVRSGWGPTYALNTRAEAERQFINTVNSENSGNLYLHPEDFALYCVGEEDTVELEKSEYFAQQELIMQGYNAAELRK